MRRRRLLRLAAPTKAGGCVTWVTQHESPEVLGVGGDSADNDGLLVAGDVGELSAKGPGTFDLR